MATNQLEIVWTQASRLPPADLAQLIKRAADALARQSAPSTPRYAALFGSAGSEKFRQAQAWLAANRAIYLGQWVCLDGDKLVSHGADAKQVYAEAKAQGLATPFMEQVQAEETGPYWGGWD